MTTQHPSRPRGFTLIELLLAIAIIAMIATFVMVSQRSSQLKRNDIRRSTDISALQKALALLSSTSSSFPTMTGCITGSDTVSTQLRTAGIISASDILADPVNPTDVAKCYYYVSTGSTYSLRYTMETEADAWNVGNNYASP